jgi:hypothetical protein
MYRWHTDAGYRSLDAQDCIVFGAHPHKLLWNESKRNRESFLQRD